MSYKSIHDSTQLPALGPLPEDLRFDMKMQVPGPMLAHPEPVDLATDMAAFANTAGGVLLVGAHELPRDSGILSAFVTLTYGDAQKVVDAYKRALDLCSPRPVVEAKPIARAAGSAEFVVVVNCEPYAAPPIGVAQPGQGGGEKWWTYPVRRGAQTYNLRPEEIATIMDPKLRRMSLLLGRLPRSGGNPIAFVWTARQGADFEIMQVDPDASTILLRELISKEQLVVPLDDVTSVWTDQKGSNNIGLSGKITCGQSSQGAKFWNHNWRYSPG